MCEFSEQTEEAAKSHARTHAHTCCSVLEAPQRDALQPADSGSRIQQRAATHSGPEWRVGAGAVAGPLVTDEEGVGVGQSSCGCKEENTH